MNNEHISSAAVAAPGNGASVHDPNDHLGGVIRYLRQQLGMTQEELAQALGITVGTVSRWEKGRFRPSRLARVLILDFARAHNITVNLKTSARNA